MLKDSGFGLILIDNLLCVHCTKVITTRTSDYIG